MILIAYDGSAGADHAIAFAFETELASETDRARAVVETGVERARAAGFDADGAAVCRAGSPAIEPPDGD
jgi:hypothetical protein